MKTAVFSLQEAAFAAVYLLSLILARFHIIISYHSLTKEIMPHEYDLF